jgi:hypothetical protein
MGADSLVCVCAVFGELGGGSGCTDRQPWRGFFCEGRVSQLSVQASCGGSVALLGPHARQRHDFDRRG